MSDQEIKDNTRSGKPLKRHKALVPLSHDHHHGLALCFKIRTGLKKGVETERVKDYVVDFFDQHLQKHFRDEEKVLLEWLAEDNEKRKETEKQHARIYHLRTQMDQKEALSELLSQFEKELNAHIRFEERDLFPYLQDTFSEAQLKKIGAQLEASHTEFCETWPDRFWEK